MNLFNKTLPISSDFFLPLKNWKINWNKALSIHTKMTHSSHYYDPTQLKLMDEQIILVDQSDNPIGQASKYEAHRNSNITSGMLHRAFSLFLFSPTNDSKFKLLLQERSFKKITFPGMLTNTCCSHPQNTEQESNGVAGCKHAAVRKVKHELGITTLSPLDLTFFGRIQYSAQSCSEWGENEIDYLLVGKLDPMNQAIEPNENEVKSICWVEREELDQMFLNKTFSFTPWFTKLHNSGILGSIWNELEGKERSIEDKIIRF